MDLFNVMANKKILIQDVGNSIELTRYFAHNIYRRDALPKDNTVADFFAPYFTAPAEQEINLKGICMYSPVLFVYAGEKDAVKTYLQESLTTLKAAKCFDNTLLNKWFTGIDLIGEASTDKDTYVYYFLADPIELHKRLLKNTDSTKGLLNLNSTLPSNLTKTMAEFYNALLQDSQPLWDE